MKRERQKRERQRERHTSDERTSDGSFKILKVPSKWTILPHFWSALRPSSQ